MKTHRLYTTNKHLKLYFCGSMQDTFDELGCAYTDVVWDWTEDINRAVLFTSTDAWDLWSCARKEYKTTQFEVERIMTLEEIQRNLGRQSVEI